MDGFDGFLLKHRHLIHDRDPLFGGQFQALLRSAGIESVRTPPRSPNLNAYAKRFVRSIKEECRPRSSPSASGSAASSAPPTAPPTTARFRQPRMA